MTPVSSKRRTRSVTAGDERPQIVASQPGAQRTTLLALGAALGLMNACFYQAVARLPLGTVGAIEFIGPIVLAAYGTRTPRNIIALVLAACGGWALTDARLSGEPLGYLFAFANCALFMLYVVLGHRVAQDGASARATGVTQERIASPLR
jgi:inner membrane transporter RhtA